MKKIEKIRKISVFLIVLFLTFGIFGCSGGKKEVEEEKKKVTCISCDENITWTSYGPYKFDNAGGDTTAWSIVENCGGWHQHGSHGGGSGDTFQIAACISEECSPETKDPYETNLIEDYCDIALVIPYLPFRGTGNTENVVVDENAPDPCDYSGSHSVWYVYEAIQDGYVTVNTYGSDFYATLTAFEGSCTEFRQIGCDFQFRIGISSRLVFPITSGETYYIMVDSYKDASGGNLKLNIAYSKCHIKEGVVLVWAYQNFNGFRVREGWTGSTNNGIRIGSTLQGFLSAYDYFEEQDSGSYKYEEDDVKVIATFDQNNELEELMVGHYFRP